MLAGCSMSTKDRLSYFEITPEYIKQRCDAREAHPSWCPSYENYIQE